MQLHWPLRVYTGVTMISLSKLASPVVNTGPWINRNVTSVSQGGVSISIISESINEKSTSMLIMRHLGPAHGAPGAWHWGCPCVSSLWLSPQLSNCLCHCYQPPKVAVCLQFQEGNLLLWRAWLFSLHPSTSPGYVVYVSIIISHGECQ